MSSDFEFSKCCNISSRHISAGAVHELYSTFTTLRANMMRKTSSSSISSNYHQFLSPIYRRFIVNRIEQANQFLCFVIYDGRNGIGYSHQVVTLYTVSRSPTLISLPWKHCDISMFLLIRRRIVRLELN